MKVSVLALNVEGTDLFPPIIVDVAPDSLAFALNYGGLFIPPMRAAPLHLPQRPLEYLRLRQYLTRR